MTECNRPLPLVRKLIRYMAIIHYAVLATSLIVLGLILLGGPDNDRDLLLDRLSWQGLTIVFTGITVGGWLLFDLEEWHKYSSWLPWWSFLLFNTAIGLAEIVWTMVEVID